MSQSSSNASFRLGQDQLTTHILVNLASRPSPAVEVTPEQWARLEKFSKIVDQVAEGDKRVYGINTGFGFLSDVAIAKPQLRQLQLNLVRSHACGVGAPVAREVVRALLILRAHTFLLGHSGVSRSTVETILAFLRHDILPEVPEQGSVGASGDLAPLAHLALGLLGEGRAVTANGMVPIAELCRTHGISPISPRAKEGLSLINGTQFMSTVAAFAVEDAKKLMQSADVMAALSLEAIRGTAAAFDSRIQAVRSQPGQALVASNLRALLEGPDQIMDSHANCGRVQDPYSFRCVPQVHGASRDVLAYVKTVVDRELNSVTDNPLVFEDGDVLSGGNFHGQPLAMAMDFLGIAVAELGSISERRIEKLTNPAMSGQPAFLVKESGLNSGFMIPHVVAAALVSENKILCHPASVDSIPTSADKEDHVSMGPIAARKARQIAHNVGNILAVEALAACQGIDLLAPLRPAPALALVFDEIRKVSPSMPVDRSLSTDIRHVAEKIMTGGFASLCPMIA
jgi:histidine ammonia-lyase